MQVFASKDAEIEDLRKRLAATEKARVELQHAHDPCHDIIKGLKKDLKAAKAEHEPCAAQIKELKEHLARLDKELAAELEKEEALAKELAEEKRKEAELEQSLKKTKADLEKDERDLAEDKKVSEGGQGFDGMLRYVGAKGTGAWRTFTGMRAGQED